MKRLSLAAVTTASMLLVAGAITMRFVHSTGLPPVVAATLNQIKGHTWENPVKKYGMAVLPPHNGDDLTNLFDAYGQVRNADWPGKIHSDADLQKAKEQEASALASTSADSHLDEYGGWIDGPKLTPAGFFKTAKIDGRWWLVTPSGHVFFSVGVDGVNDSDPTPLDGRRTMFAWLPQPEDPLAKHFGHSDAFVGPETSIQTFDFYQANLDRKYGADFDSAWDSITTQRLHAWRFNTLGAWANPRLLSSGMPFIIVKGIRGDFHRVASGLDVWGKMPDPFDPKFQTATAQSLRIVTPTYKNNRSLIGYCVDNELSWANKNPNGRFGLAYGALADDIEGSPAKQEFLSELHRRYSTIDALNTSWRTQFGDWSDLDASYHAPQDLSDGMKQDMADFTLAYARRYFQIVRDELHRQDPNHLYLGCRFSEGRSTPENLQAAAEFCDVISFNAYFPTINDSPWRDVSGLNKPCLVTEFNFVAEDRGEYSRGLSLASSQEDRGRRYADFVRAVATNPAFVGCHWFDYIDEPASGAPFVGENANTGFVDIADTPYPELTAAATQANSDVYRWRLGSSTH